jgi:hypothetical protein
VFDFHALRGMCATLLALANTPLTMAQKILRHSTPILTANFYTLYELEQKSEALARIPSLDPAGTVPAAGGEETPVTPPESGGDDAPPDGVSFALTLMPPDAMNGNARHAG